jgi:hypothetical protein
MGGGRAYRLFVNIHEMVPNTEERQDPPDTLVSDASGLFFRRRIDADLREQLVALVGVAVGQLGRVDGVGGVGGRGPLRRVGIFELAHLADSSPCGQKLKDRMVP